MKPAERSTTPYVPTDRGRVRAVLATVEGRWDSLTCSQQVRAVELIAALSAAVRSQEVRAIPCGRPDCRKCGTRPAA